MYRLKVKSIAQARGLSQGKVARMCDVDENIIQKIYRNPSVSITLHTLDKIAMGLDVDIRELIESIPIPQLPDS
jgi:transcriptional regulator with XRE-family HTH domain